MLFDLIGALCSLLSTYYFIRMDNKAWGIGMIATCLNGVLYWYNGIYADMTLESFYFFTMVYGWHKWHSLEKTNYNHAVKQLNYLHAFILLILFCIGFNLIYFILIYFTNSSIPALDAFTTTLSLIAQWLMCHKIMMTWVLWFITDAIYAWIYLTKAIPFHALLMIIYMGMAITGYLFWMREQERRVTHQQLDSEFP